MMIEPLENEYFNWLCAKVLDSRGPMYRDLLSILHRTEFVWSILGDKNRAEDGCELRQDFLRESRWEEDDIWFHLPCSVLEMLIAFSSRAWFQTDVAPREWFWIFLTNLGLDEYRRVSASDVSLIEDILNTFVHRNYAEGGQGGIFPMRWPQHDQREVEIWYQFCEYLEDQELV